MYILPLQAQAHLTTLYMQPHRYYHNINHINDSLVELYDYSFNVPTSKLIEIGVIYGIWYHDVIYNPYAPSGLNETQSAEIFRQQHGHHVEISSRMVECEEIAYAIKCTANHIHDQSLDNDNLTKILLDIDLAGLGKSSDIFSKNSWNIRQEYYRTSDTDFINGRLKFFTELTNRKSFYYTDYFKNLYHNKSKENVAHEIYYLEEAVRKGSNDIYFDDLFSRYG